MTICFANSLTTEWDSNELVTTDDTDDSTDSVLDYLDTWVLMILCWTADKW